MENSTNNPLAKHFRQPAIFLKLPSGGRYYPDGALELNLTGEIPVYPMTVKDELLLKTPDALMNGNSVSEMIKSCCPSIKDTEVIPLIDLDPILIAIRLASYGQGMDITSKCKNCGADNEHTIDLRNLLDSLPSLANLSNVAKHKDLTFTFKPLTYAYLNVAGLAQFEQKKILATVSDSDIPDDERTKLFEESFKRLADLNISSLVNCIESIQLDTGERVGDAAHIKEFLNNTDRATYDTVDKLINDFVAANAIPPVDVECSECKTQYKVVLEFNQTNFFE